MKVCKLSSPVKKIGFAVIKLLSVKGTLFLLAIQLVNFIPQ